MVDRFQTIASSDTAPLLRGIIASAFRGADFKLVKLDEVKDGGTDFQRVERDRIASTGLRGDDIRTVRVSRSDGADMVVVYYFDKTLPEITFYYSGINGREEVQVKSSDMEKQPVSTEFALGLLTQVKEFVFNSYLASQVDTAKGIEKYRVYQL